MNMEKCGECAKVLYTHSLISSESTRLSSSDKQSLLKNFRRWAMKNHPDKGGSTVTFQTVSNCVDLIAKENKCDGSKAPKTASNFQKTKSFTLDRPTKKQLQEALVKGDYVYITPRNYIGTYSNGIFHNMGARSITLIRNLGIRIVLMSKIEKIEIYPQTNVDARVNAWNKYNKQKNAPKQKAKPKSKPKPAQKQKAKGPTVPELKKEAQKLNIKGRSKMKRQELIDAIAKAKRKSPPKKQSPKKKSPQKKDKCAGKTCSADKVCNPASGRCVKRTGAIGKRILKK